MQTSLVDKSASFTYLICVLQSDRNTGGMEITRTRVNSSCKQADELKGWNYSSHVLAVI